MSNYYPDVAAAAFPADHPLSVCKGFVFDVDGVLVRGEETIPRSPEAIERLRRGGKKVIFISNNSTKSREEYIAKFTRIGIPVTADDLVLSTYATARYVANEKPRAKVYMVGAPGLRRELELAGLELVDDPLVAEYAVVGSAFNGKGQLTPENGERITGALRALYHAGAKFIATNPDRIFPAKDGVIPGTGAVIGALSYMVDRQPDAIIGKPSPYIVKIALNRLGLSGSECAIVGDMDTDMLAGKGVDMTTIFVRSGAMSEEKLRSLGISPGFVFDSVIDILEAKEQ
ncbi:MAG TPA: HAD-IIA family hydrolase [Candidatus Acetothermia bacterium]|nr:HAD-IIA family hydrolase [Candidatus Acetothermia bacterium]